MATAQQLADLVWFVAGLSTHDEIQTELDSVNARLEAVNGEKVIVLQILDSGAYTVSEKLELIRETLVVQT